MPPLMVIAKFSISQPFLFVEKILTKKIKFTIIFLLKYERKEIGFMKRTERVGSIIKTLVDAPNVTFSLSYFCDKYDAAKSSISEDIQAASRAISETGTGRLETIVGAKGGVKYVPEISDKEIDLLRKEFADRLSDSSRLLGGNFIYTSDLFYDAALVQKIALFFAKKFSNTEADYIATVETKGIPLAFSVAKYMGLPLVVARREAKISEGSTVSINYFSGSYDRIQKMSMSKRAMKPNSKVIVIDDFMRGGGSINGITEMINEFGSEVSGVGVAIAVKDVANRKIKDFECLVQLGDVDFDSKKIEIFALTN